jgi:hypothetical protein
MKHFILMADIVSSGSLDSTKAMASFKKLVQTTNKQHKAELLSPLTITLGDEFQGIICDLSAALRIMISLEEGLISLNPGFRLRYSLNYGEIGTPINPKIAHEMLGDGLTKARKNLNELKNSKSRFSISLVNKKMTQIFENAFTIYQQIVDRWKPENDYDIAAGLIESHDYKIVAKKLGRNRSLIWKREKNLDMISYFAIRNLITQTASL